MSDPRPPKEGMAPFAQSIAEIKRRVQMLETASGTQRVNLRDEVMKLFDDLSAQVQQQISQNSYTKAEIDNKVTNPGNINPGNVNASGSLTAQGFITLPGVLSHSNANFRTLTSGDNGEIGISSSSARYKEDIEDFDLTEETFRAIHPRQFRYKSDVEEFGDDAVPDVGFIAEELVAAGVTEPVYYDPEGRPEGINYDRLTPHLWAMNTQLLDRVGALESAVTKLLGRIPLLKIGD